MYKTIHTVIIPFLRSEKQLVLGQLWHTTSKQQKQYSICIYKSHNYVTTYSIIQSFSYM